MTNSLESEVHAQEFEEQLLRVWTFCDDGGYRLAGSPTGAAGAQATLRPEGALLAGKEIWLELGTQGALPSVHLCLREGISVDALRVNPIRLVVTSWEFPHATFATILASATTTFTVVSSAFFAVWRCWISCFAPARLFLRSLACAGVSSCTIGSNVVRCMRRP